MKIPAVLARLVAVSLAVSLLAPAARADIIEPGYVRVPVALTIDGQEAFADSSVLVFGCLNEERHHFAFAKPKEALRCQVKGAPSVYVILAKDRKAFDDLLAKNPGWAGEVAEGQKILDKLKAKPCGDIDERTSFDKAKGVTLVNATYALAKTATGCSLKQVSSANVVAASSATASASASAAPPSSAVPSASTTPAPSAAVAPPKKSGCSAGGGAGGGTLGILLAIGSAVLARRALRSSRR